MADFLKECSIEGCGNPAKARGWCGTHSQRYYRTGSPHIVRKEVILGTLTDRFWARVEKTEGCWIWTGSRSAAGYGQVGHNGSLIYAHRLAHEMLVGPIPEGFQIDHLCRVRACVRPEHLEAVTQQENIRRQFEATHVV